MLRMRAGIFMQTFTRNQTFHGETRKLFLPLNPPGFPLRSLEIPDMIGFNKLINTQA